MVTLTGFEVARFPPFKTPLRAYPARVRFHAARLGLATLLALSVSCRRPPPIGAERADASSGLRIEAPRGDAPPPEASREAFSVVARDVRWRLLRVEGSPVLGVDTNAPRVYVLDGSSPPTPLAPLSATLIERFPAGMQIGYLAGRWPDTLVVEGWTMAGRGGSVVSEAVVDLRAGTARTSGASTYTAGAWTWKGGALLGFAAEGPSGMGPFVFGRRGAFRVLAGPKPRSTIPVLPPLAASLHGEFVAYPSGTIFALAGKKSAVALTSDTTVKDEVVWRLADGAAPAAIELPVRPVSLLRGREESETLMVGENDLLRWNGTAFVRLTLPSSATTITSAAVADDGSIWLATGKELFTARFPEPTFTKVVLGPELAPVVVSARSEKDVWVLSGERSPYQRDTTEGAATLLHRQETSESPRAPFRPQGDEDFEAAMLAGRPPTPYDPSCRIPLLALGAPGEVNEDDARTLAKSLAAGGGFLVRGRTKERSVVAYAFERTSGYSDADDVAKVKAALARARGRFPGATALCTRLAEAVRIE